MLKKCLVFFLFSVFSCSSIASMTCPDPTWDMKLWQFEINSDYSQARARIFANSLNWDVLIEHKYPVTKEFIREELFFADEDFSYEQNGQIYCVYKSWHPRTIFTAISIK